MRAGAEIERPYGTSSANVCKRTQCYAASLDGTQPRFLALTLALNDAR